VGVAEKRIAAMFAEAERNGQLLLLDEADSMLQDRRLSTRSWEVSHTNELLTQMENFRGVFVACTNFLDRLDRAALRRFAWKVRLEAMDGPRRERMFARWFPRLGLDEGARERLSRIPRLSPGDFKAVATLFEDRLEAAPEAAPEAVPELGTTLDAVLDALAEEASYRQTPEDKRRPAGFLP
jgi:SpoVK/Ycf46/Vps4 family AAA+-type ATPase